MRYPLLRCLAVLPLLAGSTLARAESQDFKFVAHSVTIDPVQQTANFSITFNQPPSFAEVDGTQIKAFQYEIDSDQNHSPPPFGFDAIIRGGEIWEGNGIPIREGTTTGGGANSGGWGPVRVTVPFQLSDNTITFTTTWKDLDDTDGVFNYHLFTVDSGATTASVQASTASIPLPAGVWTGMIALACLAVGAKIRRFAH